LSKEKQLEPYKDAFKLTEKKLRDIHAAAISRMGEAGLKEAELLKKYKVSYKDNLVDPDCKNLDEIFSKYGRDEVWSLEIIISKNDATLSPQISLEFIHPERIGQISIRCKAIADTDDWISGTLERVLSQKIKNIKCFSLARELSKSFVFAIVILIGLGAFLYGAVSFFFFLLSAPSNQSSNPYPFLLHPLNNIILFFILYILIAASIFIGIRYYPPYTFHWGDYAEIYERKNRKGAYLLGPVILAIVISIVTAIITK
jgi:hypothetical protein